MDGRLFWFRCDTGSVPLLTSTINHRGQIFVLVLVDAIGSAGHPDRGINPAVANHRCDGFEHGVVPLTGGLSEFEQHDDFSLGSASISMVIMVIRFRTNETY